MINPELSEAEQALLPFMAWSRPLIAAAQKRVFAVLHKLDAAHPDLFDVLALSDSVHAAFMRPVLAASQRALVLELAIARHQQSLPGETPQQRFAAFIAWIDSRAGRRAIDASYPRLREDVVQAGRQVARFLSGVLRNVAADQARLAQLSTPAPGRLLKFKTEMGDRHADGCNVVRLEFSNARLYYKPRPMAVDVAFSRLLAWLEAEGVEPDQRTAQALDCGHYGYVRDVTYQSAHSEAELHAYYRRFGGLAAITYILGSTDLHHENLIAAGAWPIIIDTETLFQPTDVARRGARTRRHLFADTVLYSGLLPKGTFSASHADTTALFMPDESRHMRVPSDAGTDQMRLQVQAIPAAFSRNMARLNEAVVPPHRYLDAVCEGFESTYRGLLARKVALRAEDGPLAPFRTLSVRVVLRPTRIYGSVLNMLSHPDYLDAQAQREALIARLRPAPGVSPVMRRCWVSERLALLRGDVPHFSAGIDSCDLVDDMGQPIPKAFAASGWQLSRRIIKRLSVQDLVRQSRLVRLAVGCTRAPEERTLPALPARMPGTQVPFAAADFVAEAIRLGDVIAAAAMGDKEHVIYYELDLRGHKVWRPFPMRAAWPDGLAGMAIFFGELARASGAPRFLREAERALASARRELTQYGQFPESIGAYSGLSGWVYALALLGIRLQRPEWIEEACSLLPELALRIGAADETATALLVLVELERVAPGKGARDLARQCAEHLMVNAISDEQGVRWIGEPVAASGFVRGTACIAAALGRYALLSNDAPFLALARAAMDADRASGDPVSGLGLLALPASMRDTQWQRDLGGNVADVIGAGSSGDHCLAQGEFGKLELLMQAAAAGDALADAHWHDMATHMLHACKNAWRTGRQDALGFMGGLAGIAYSMLRIADPVGVPAVVSLQLRTAD